VQKLLAVCGIAGPVIYAIVIVVLGSLEPNYSHLSQTMSVLGDADARYSIVMNTAGIPLLGVLIIAFAIGLDRGIDTGRFSKLGPAFLGVSGLCLIIMGFFPCDTGDDITFSGRTHNALATIAAAAMILSLLSLSLRLWADERWRNYFTYTMCTVLVTLVFAALYAFDVFESWEGALQRISMAAPLIWIEVMSIKLLRLS